MSIATTLEQPDPVLPAPPTGSPRGTLRRLRARVSLVLFVAMHVACLLVIAYPPTWPLVLLALGSYLLRMWAITVGFHRYFAHRSFRVSRAFQFVLALLGASRNNPLLAALTLGEGWRNNHHFYTSSARQGFFWWEADVSYYTLVVLSWLGLVRDIRKPPAWVLAGDLRVGTSGGSSDAPRHARTDDDRIDEAGEGSFPARDPPPWPLGRERPS